MLILMTCIVIVGILGGGYYVSVSAVTGIVLTGVLFYRMYVKKRITAAWDLNMAAFAVLVFGYLLSCLWAVDSGMALMGVVKFLPLLLFYVLVSGLTDEREKMIASLPMLGCLMAEFCDPKKFKVILASGREKYRILRLEELLPFGFG